MKLSHELSKIFEKEMEKVIQREIDDPDYLPHSYFEDSKIPCTDRATNMILDAMSSVINTLAFAIAEHRKEHHKEDTTVEVGKLKEILTEEQIEISTRGWWSD